MISDLDNLAIVDVETTGGRSSGADRVIEIGIVLVDNNKVSKTFSSLINPGRSVNPYIFQMTGISPYELADAPTFDMVSESVWDLLEDRIFVAHNARFDYGFIKSEFSYLDKQFQSKHLCTVQLSRRLFPEHKRHGLSAIIDRFGLPMENRHRALDDAMAIWHLFQTSTQLLGKNRLLETFNQILKKPALPRHIAQYQIDQLPECPGVYTFVGEGGEILYIGKSINIKDRVKSHFYSDLHNPIELKLKDHVYEIQTQTTAGELEALLLESKLIKTKMPIYNQKLRRQKTLQTLKLIENKDGYLEFLPQRSSQIEISDLNSGLSVFRNASDFKNQIFYLTKEFQLCNKLTGAEKTKSACFAHRLRQCKGACVGKEDPEEYNKRVKKAFAKFSIPKWKYKTPHAVCERNDLTGQTSYLWFDNWCFLGRSDEPDFVPNGDLQFDYDTYSIMKGYLRKSLKN